MMTPHRTILGVGLMAFAVTRAAWTQAVPDAVGAVAGEASSALVALRPDGARAAVGWQSAQPVPKSPVVAGVLSGVLFPGLGSYYAGNAGHGTVHLVVQVATGMALFKGGARAWEDAGTKALFFAWVGNWVWSIFTAISDANAYNRAHLSPRSAAAAVPRDSISGGARRGVAN